jgi:hypothetical protein
MSGIGQGGVASPSTVVAFNKALAEFKVNSGLPQRDLDALKVTTLGDLKTTIYRLQQERKASRTSKYMKRLDPFLKSMEQFGKVIAVFVNTSDILACVWVC